MTASTFRLPDVGEGLTEAEIVAWRVGPGQIVDINDLIVEIETAKSVVELPSPYAGTVAMVHCREGQTVAVGEPLITVTAATAQETTGRPTADAAGASPDAVDQGVPTDHGKPDVGAVLVGYGPVARSGGRRRRGRGSCGDVAPDPTPPRGRHDPIGQQSAPIRPSASGAPPVQILASPPTRLLARELGVDLQAVTATGQHGQISRDDVLREHSAARTDRATTTPAPRAAAPSSEAGTTDDTPAEPRNGVLRIPIRGVRRATAAAMVASKFTAPHATEFVTVDVTGALEMVRQLRDRPAFDGLTVTPLLLVAKALLVAVGEHPQVNATWREAEGEIWQFSDVNLGIATATERGLMVPNIKAAQGLSLLTLAQRLTESVRLARDGRATPAQMAGGTITITNIGSFGIDAGTPILNPGEAAILCMGAVRTVPWVVDGHIEPRPVMTLSLAFDHRLVDGDLGSRVLARTAGVLREPLWELALA